MAEGRSPALRMQLSSIRRAVVHVAIGKPGLIQPINPRTDVSTQFTVAVGTKTTALILPDHLHVFSSLRHGVLDLAGA